ncbi:PopZ family protein [Hoeflea sp.]|uniref:PopZ family protein n=1 Tax=Hoeflea sp. TaxID=1940281 RepID=UPI0019A5EFA3|nr:PopZ family protein [Hoeflea sp.]MBC7280782.1 DUF2497 domain-containing protein [Hoeflea sp.]
MGQAGAQREPSMEEILASIRRIIENNEPALDGSHVEAVDTSARHYDDDDDDDDAYADDQAGSDAHDQPRAEFPDEQAVARPVSLAEVAALARATPRHQDSRSEEQASDNQAPAPRAAEHPAPANSESDMAEMDDAAAEELRDALMSNEPVEAPSEIETASAEAEQPDHSGQRANDMHAVEHQSAGHSQTTGQLVSLQTGEKVAAAFGELDAAIAAGQSRSFDEIAEEMLRPMLTQWLDDNLPTLVERLVREEIERVSRGNRR